MVLPVQVHRGIKGVVKDTDGNGIKGATISIRGIRKDVTTGKHILPGYTFSIWDNFVVNFWYVWCSCEVYFTKLLLATRGYETFLAMLGSWSCRFNNYWIVDHGTDIHGLHMMNPNAIEDTLTFFFTILTFVVLSEMSRQILDGFAMISRTHMHHFGYPLAVPWLPSSKHNLNMSNNLVNKKGAMFLSASSGQGT